MKIVLYGDRDDVPFDIIHIDDEDLPEFLRISTIAACYDVSRQAMHKYREYNKCTWAETFEHFIARKQAQDRKKALNAHNRFAK
ncbi:hypothetical protein N1D67_004566 [Escherichia coli]|nr:hypothetical protein [Escherichia coli]